MLDVRRLRVLFLDDMLQTTLGQEQAQSAVLIPGALPIQSKNASNDT
jgi:hypothetical protein